MVCLGVLAAPKERVAPEDRVTVPGEDGVYRRWKEGEAVPAYKVAVGFRERRFLVLRPGDRVKRGQVVAVVAPTRAVTELKTKWKLLDAAEADRGASEVTRDEALKRRQAMGRQRRISPRSVSDDDYRGAKLSWERYTQEEIALAAAVRRRQHELRLAAAELNAHEVRSPLAGYVKVLYRRVGECVKELEPVLRVEVEGR
jgi:multidrug efflux pump subunit AcrA (membrane-fusion protein)